LEFKANEIYNVDCLIGLNQLENVDLIVADPPYVISRKSNFHTMKDRKSQRTGTMLGLWDVEFDNDPWIKLAAGTLKDGGSLVTFNAWSRATIIEDLCTKHGLIYKDTLVWHKSNPMPRNRDRRYIPNVEMIQWYVKKGKWTFNRQNDKYESSVLSFASESGGGFKRYHPTQKPVKLIEHLIKIHSNEGDLVVDPFMGSGTTAVASINTKRRFIGFEIDEQYYQKAKGRIETKTRLGDNDVRV
jgi:DNA modification methylase